MKITIKKIPDILNDNLSLIERGILITIILVRDSKPSYTLAKAKKEINFSKHKQELISLHEKGYISWSSYDAAKKSLEKKEIKPQIIEILDFMNSLYQRDFGVVETRITLLEALLKKYSVEDIKKVVANRYSVWKEDETMKRYLNPETVFRMSKFVKYFDEVRFTKEGESYLNAIKIDLKEGDEITYSIAQSFTDSETYSFKAYDLDSQEKRVGIGVKETRYGKDIKGLLKRRDLSESKRFLLIYIQK